MKRMIKIAIDRLERLAKPKTTPTTDSVDWLASTDSRMNQQTPLHRIPYKVGADESELRKTIHQNNINYLATLDPVMARQITEYSLPKYQAA